MRHLSANTSERWQRHTTLAFLSLLAQWMAMSNDDPSPTTTATTTTTTAPESVTRLPPAPDSRLFEIPPAVKRILDHFPLLTYGENELPLRAPQKSRDAHVLYVFSTAEDARNGRPSFNPGCLKWQVGWAIFRSFARTTVD